MIPCFSFATVYVSNQQCKQSQKKLNKIALLSVNLTTKLQDKWLAVCEVMKFRALVVHWSIFARDFKIKRKYDIYVCYLLEKF